MADALGDAGAATRLRRLAAEHRAAGRPLAAHDCYRGALTLALHEMGASGDAAAAATAHAIANDLRLLLIELGRDSEAAALDQAVNLRP